MSKEIAQLRINRLVDRVKTQMRNKDTEESEILIDFVEEYNKIIKEEL